MCCAERTWRRLPGKVGRGRGADGLVWLVDGVGSAMGGRRACCWLLFLSFVPQGIVGLWRLTTHAVVVVDVVWGLLLSSRFWARRPLPGPSCASARLGPQFRFCTMCSAKTGQGSRSIATVGLAKFRTCSSNRNPIMCRFERSAPQLWWVGGRSLSSGHEVGTDSYYETFCRI